MENGAERTEPLVREESSPGLSKLPVAKTKSKLKKKENILVGHFMLGPELGRGGFGAVYQGLDIHSGAMVALKKLPVHNNEKEIQDLQKEVKFLQQYRHENIINYMETITTPTHFVLVLEYMENGSLSDIVEQYGVFPENLSALYIQQVLTGLSFLHSHKVVHMDIKASNILIAKDGVVKLADCGIASKLHDRESTFAEDFHGLPYWTAPEVISYEGKTTTKCDVWSVGCTIIELCTGNPPFGDLDYLSAVWKVVHEDIRDQYPPESSSKLCSFLDCCLNKNVTERSDPSKLLKHPWILEHTKKSNRMPYSELRAKVKEHNRSMFGIEYEESESKIAKDPVYRHSAIHTLSSQQREEYKKQQIQKYQRQQEEHQHYLEKVRQRQEEISQGGMNLEGLKLSITGTTTREVGPKIWIEYQMRVELKDSLFWISWRRYRLFFLLHNKLKKELGDKVVLPILPPKRPFGNLAPAFVETRKKQLQTYLQELQKNPQVLENQHFKMFLVGKLLQIDETGNKWSPIFFWRRNTIAQLVICVQN